MFSFNYSKIDFSHKLGVASFPEDDFSKHIHYFYEIIFFVNGKVNYSVESESRDLVNGNLVLIKPGQVHFANVNEDETYERYVLKFPESLLPDYLKSKLATIGPFFSNTKVYSYIFEKLDDYVKRFNEEDAYTLLVCELLSLCVFISNEMSVESQKNTSTMVQKILDYIDTNIRSDLTLKEITGLFNYSTQYVAKEFKNVMRVSLVDYVKSKRVFFAHQLILNGMKANIAAIEAGFSDYSTFYRTYIRIIGCKPSDHNK